MAGEVLKGSQVIKSWLLRSRSGSEPVVGIEVLSGLPHDMEHHCELARQRYGGALEAETLLERQSPGAQRAGRAHQGVFLIEEPADVGLEDPTLALGHDKAEGLHQSADLIGKVGRNIEKLSTGGRERLREHGVAALDAHLLVPAGANEMRQPIGVVGIGLVGPHIERALGLPSIKAYHRSRRLLSSVQSQVVNGPVSRPIRTAPGACLQMAVSSSSGWLAHLPRQTRPPASSRT